MPPALAKAMAIFDSVTVSIADDMNGTLVKFLDSFNEISVSEGRISNTLVLKVHHQTLKTLYRSHICL